MNTLSCTFSFLFFSKMLPSDSCFVLTLIQILNYALNVYTVYIDTNEINPLRKQKEKNSSESNCKIQQIP